MKKLWVIAIMVIGAASAAKADGFRLNVGLPLPPPPHVVLGRLLSPPSVTIAPGGCYQPPVVRDGCYSDRGYYSSRYDYGAGYGYRSYCREHHRYDCNHRSHRGHWDRQGHHGYRR